MRSGIFFNSGHSLRRARTKRACGLQAFARRGCARTAFARPKFKIQNDGSGRSLRSDRTSGRELRAFAGRSCGPLRLLSEAANS